MKAMRARWFAALLLLSATALPALAADEDQGPDADEPAAASWLAEYMPGWLTGAENQFFNVEYWQWLGLLVIVLVPTIGREVNGARRWIRLNARIGLQPSEFAKLALVIWVRRTATSSR